MLKTKNLKLVLSGIALIAACISLWLFNGSNKVNAAEELNSITQSLAMPGLLSEGYLPHSGGWQGRSNKDSNIDYTQLLADALGITVEELETACETARDSAIEQALAQGLITQEQADQIKVRGGFGGRRGFDFGHTPKGDSDEGIDENTLLAEALGITTDALQIARETANQAALDQALAEGLITQEQVDEMQSRKNLMSYLDRNTMLVQALGMTEEELQAAYDAGQTLSTLMSEKGLDAATVRENMQTAYTEAIAQAVVDGVITQEQADEMQTGRGFGMMPSGRMMPGDGTMHFGDHESFRGRGEERFEETTGSESDNDTNGSSRRSSERSTPQPRNDA